MAKRVIELRNSQVLGKNATINQQWSAFQNDSNALRNKDDLMKSQTSTNREQNLANFRISGGFRFQIFRKKIYFYFLRKQKFLSVRSTHQKPSFSH